MRRLVLVTLVIALAACGAAPPRPAHVVIGEARAHDERGQFDAGRAALERALRDRRGPVERAALAAELARLAASDAFARNAGYEAALALAEAARDGAAEARAIRAMAVATDAVGMVEYARVLWSGRTDFRVARDAFAAALVLYNEAGDLAGAAEAHFHAGLTFEQMGHHPLAAERYTAALALAERVQDRGVIAYAERHLAGIADERGDLAAARRGFERSLELREAMGAARLVPYALIALADLDLEEGAVAAALARYRRALALAEQLGQKPGLVWAHVGLAGGLEKAGAPAEALAHYEQALALAEAAQVAIGIVAAATAAAKLAAPERAQVLLDAAARAAPKP
ncbi:MAG: tetratricopeptide repeat protein [Deltaproteobacteria bacterium]|nr:tetratricopeptide repeat protein [Deltaproteobacteria bacterium]